MASGMLIHELSVMVVILKGHAPAVGVSYLRSIAFSPIRIRSIIIDSLVLLISNEGLKQAYFMLNATTVLNG